jgi:hypothetical protein
MDWQILQVLKADGERPKSDGRHRVFNVVNLEAAFTSDAISPSVIEKVFVKMYSSFINNERHYNNISVKVLYSIRRSLYNSYPQ